MDNTNSQLIQSSDSLVTLLRVQSGYTNDKGEIYDKDGVFIDFPRELGSKKRKDLNSTLIDKHFKNKIVGCCVQERRNYSYYHWTYETLPKLIHLNKHKKELGIDKIYFHFGRFGQPYQRQALWRLGFNYWQIVDAKQIKSLKAKEIIVIRLNETRLEPSFELCQTIKSAFIQKPTQTPHKRIYLTRNHVKTGRKLLNEIELRELLKSYGFQIIIADELSVTNQAKLFNESKYIVSPHGAALANLAFCEPGTKILELFNRADKSTWSQIYSTIAQACGFNLLPLPPKQIEATRQSNHRSNFYADLALIKAALTEWGL